MRAYAALFSMRNAQCAVGSDAEAWIFERFGGLKAADKKTKKKPSHFFFDPIIHNKGAAFLLQIAVSVRVGKNGALARKPRVSAKPIARQACRICCRGGK